MIYSMTGYGKSEDVSGGNHIVVELKSVNGKQFEIINRINSIVKSFEVEIRNELIQILRRGSVDVNITIRQDGAARPMQVNTELAKRYLKSMQDIAQDLQLDIAGKEAEMLSTTMRMPEVVAPAADTLDSNDFAVLMSLLQQSAQKLMAHRKSEGLTLENDLLQRVSNIESLLESIEKYEPQRIERLRSRINDSLQQITINIDENRLEQELIYYIEKIDFSEEKQRLKTHCQYYKTIINEAGDEGIGKKLGFVLQEIGREINTLGSKANDASIQQIVVNMKDELEKAKEQALNVL